MAYPCSFSLLFSRIPFPALRVPGCTAVMQSSCMATSTGFLSFAGHALPLQAGLVTELPFAPISLLMHRVLTPQLTRVKECCISPWSVSEHFKGVDVELYTLSRMIFCPFPAREKTPRALEDSSCLSQFDLLVYGNNITT